MIAPYLKNYFGPKLWQNSTAGVQATLVRGAGEWSDCQPDCPSPRFSPRKTRSTSQASHFIFPVASPSPNSGRLHCLRYCPHRLEEQINDLPASQPAILLRFCFPGPKPMVLPHPPHHLCWALPPNPTSTESHCSGTDHTNGKTGADHNSQRIRPC